MLCRQVARIARLLQLENECGVRLHVAVRRNLDALACLVASRECSARDAQRTVVLGPDEGSDARCKLRPEARPDRGAGGCRRPRLEKRDLEGGAVVGRVRRCRVGGTSAEEVHECASPPGVDQAVQEVQRGLGSECVWHARVAPLCARRTDRVEASPGWPPGRGGTVAECGEGDEGEDEWRHVL